MPLAARVVLVVIAAATLTALSPPLNWHALHWVAYLPVMLALDPERPALNARLSWLYGIVGVGMLFHWIVHTIVLFGGLPSVVAYGILLLFSAVFGLQYVLLWPALHPLRRLVGPWWIFLFPALEVLIEWLAMRILLFPYQHGVSQYRVPYTWQLASVTGVWGVSYLLFLVNCGLAEVALSLRAKAPVPWRVVGIVPVVVALVVGFSAWRYERASATLADAPVLKVAQLQSEHGMEWRMDHSARDAWNDWLALTRELPPGAVDLVVWPEGASPYDLNETPGRKNVARQLLQDEAKRGDFAMVVGGGSRRRQLDAEMEERVVAFNSVFFFEADGDVQGSYDKIVPLPFGEYIPFQRYVPESWNDALNIGNFEAGTEAVIFEGGFARVATPICYEAILPRTCRLFRDASLLVTVTNDAWFGDTANPHQHAMLAASRSMELGIPMVRSAYTGVSMIVEPNGDWSYETEPFARVSRVAEVSLAKLDTPFARFGDWFVAVCALALLPAAPTFGRWLQARLNRSATPRHAPAPTGSS